MNSFTGRQLDGIRVLDLTRVLAGPFCTMILADLGADVVKVEAPSTGDITRALPPMVGGQSPYFSAVNRSKRSVAINFKSPEGLGLVRELVGTSDVVVDNFRPGVMERLGLTPEQLRQLKPNVISCSISGFGMNSPLTDAPSFDLVIQALSGVMSLSGEPDGPPSRFGVPMGDVCGGLWAALAIVAAVAERQRTGEGQHIDLSLLDSLMSMLGYNVGLALTDVSLLERQPNSGHPSVVPYGCYPTRDGHITIAVYGDQFWPGFCDAVERPDWATDERLSTVSSRLDNREILEREIDAVLRARGTAEWQERFTGAGVPNAPVLDVREAVLQPHTAARGAVVDLGTGTGIKAVTNPIRSTAHVEPSTHRPPPELGAHTAEVLADLLDKDAGTIERLTSDGAIAGPMST